MGNIPPLQRQLEPEPFRLASAHHPHHLSCDGHPACSRLEVHLFALSLWREAQRTCEGVRAID